MLRREFLKYAVVTAGAAGAAYTQTDKLIPYLNPEEQVLPGVSTWYATSCRECPAGCGMIVRNREGRAIKAEGNPLHPINEGRLCARGQAALQALYDPDRYRHPFRRTQENEERVFWTEAFTSVGKELANYRGRVAVITDLQSGSLAALITAWLGAFGSTRSLVYEPFNYEAVREANRQVFGRDAIPDYHLDTCDVIISFATDFTSTWLSPVKFTRRFADTREPRENHMSKFIYVGPRLDSTAFNADEYILVPPGQERLIALSMLSVIESEGIARSRASAPSGLAAFAPEAIGPKLGVKPEQIRRIARQFAQAKTPLALAGTPIGSSPVDIETAFAANLLNAAAGSTAIDFSHTHALGQAARSTDITSFMDALSSGAIQALIVIGANPAYSLPFGYRFEEAIRKLPLVVSLSSHPDETSKLASWVLPSSTYLEEWGDYEPEAGIANTMQPTMGRLYDTLPTGDILIRLAQEAGVAANDIDGVTDFRTYIQRRWVTRTGSAAWDDIVGKGGTWNTSTASAPSPTPVNPVTHFSPPSFDSDLKLWGFAHPMLYDGRGANKRWLQEIPDTVHHVVWGSWVEVHPATINKLGLQDSQALELRSSAGSVTPPVLPYQGVHPQTLAVPFGQGHTDYGRFAAGLGVNLFRTIGIGKAYSPIQSVKTALRPAKDTVVSTDGSTEEHGRKLVEILRLSELPHKHPDELEWPTERGYSPEHDLYTGHKHVAHRWAMAVDMSRCVGCESCMAACYAENNLAVVGKEWVRQGREMEWLWIDRYYDWESPHSPAHYLVSMCQQCDAAPCEPVCPVFAATHDQEGLNQQIYNRCIGTRYCSNNCPYKVRRFNWRNYPWPEPLNWQCNPDVTVRQRGVMEKCTFCIQRIRHAENIAKAEDRPVRDGEIIPACAQTCPAGVFIFGDLMDPNSRISKLVADHPRRYQVLKDLNTKPAVIYLSKVVNDT